MQGGPRVYQYYWLTVKVNIDIIKFSYWATVESSCLWVTECMNEQNKRLSFFFGIGVETTSATFNKSVVEKSGAVQAVVKVLILLFLWF